MKYLRIPPPIGKDWTLQRLIAQIVDSDARFNGHGPGIRAGGRIVSSQVVRGHIAIECDEDLTLLQQAIDDPKEWDPRWKHFPELVLKDPDGNEVGILPRRIWAQHCAAIAETFDELPVETEKKAAE